MKVKRVADLMNFRATSFNRLAKLESSRDPLLIDRGEGAHLFESSGRKFLDCQGNSAVIGHSHPIYVKNMVDQLGKLQTNARFVYDPFERMIKKILSTFPEEMSYVTFANSGAEANDTAVQMARSFAGHQGVVAVEGAYHGMLSSTLELSSLDSKTSKKASKDLTLLSNPCQFRGKFAGKEDSSQLYAQEFEEKTRNIERPIFIAEMMMNLGGLILPRKDYFRKIAEKISKRNGIFIADETSSGLGVLGSLWASQHFEVTPDIVTIGKNLGNGFPVAAIVCSQKVMDAYAKDHKEFFSTYSGSPLACVSSETVLNIIESEKLLANSAEQGRFLLEALKPALSLPVVGDLRGLGLRVALEFVKDKQSKAPHPLAAELAVQKCREQNLLVGLKGIHGNVLAIEPPIMISRSDAQNIAEIVNKACKDTSKELAASS